MLFIKYSYIGLLDSIFFRMFGLWEYLLLDKQMWQTIELSDIGFKTQTIELSDIGFKTQTIEQSDIGFKTQTIELSDIG